MVDEELVGSGRVGGYERGRMFEDLEGNTTTYNKKSQR